MPERTDRRPWLRRLAYVTSALALTFAFAFSLSGIASTQGHVQPNGQAAALAAAQQAHDAADHRDCHRGAGRRGVSRRV
jgi:hypothetical protein